MRGFLLALFLCVFSVTGQAATVEITVEGTFVLKWWEPEATDSLNLLNANYQGVFRYDSDEPLFYLEEEQVSPSGEKFMLGNFYGLNSYFQISNRPNGSPDVVHNYSNLSWSVRNFYPDGSFKDALGPLTGEFNLDGNQVYGPNWRFDFNDQNFFNGMDAPFAPLFSESDYTPVDFQFDDDYVLEISSTSVEIVPIPATAYLFGSALGLLGWIRRKAA